MHLSRLRRMGFGAAELGCSSSEILIRISLLIFYTNYVGIRPDLASYAIAIGVVWDAITDPLIGRFSDRANFFGQKRRPFFWPGALGLALSLTLVFNPPELSTQMSKFFYLLLTYLGTNTFLTVLSIPHVALGADQSVGSHVRTELFAWRLIFSNFGLILGTIIPAVILAFMPAIKQPEMLTSLVTGILTVCAVSVTWYASKGYDQAAKQDSSRFKVSEYFYSLISVAKNSKFAVLWLSYMISTLGLTLNSSIALYYYKYFLKLDELVVRLIIAFFMIIFCLGIPFWVWASRYISKHLIIASNVILLGLMTAVGYPLFPEGEAIYPVVASIFGGIFVSSVVLMEVLVADLADSSSNGDAEGSSAGLYFGIWKMGAKLSRAVALILTGHALTWIGYDAEILPSLDVSNGIALLFGPGVGIPLIISGFVLLYASKKGS